MPAASFRPALESLETREVPARVFGLTPANRIVIFDSANPGVVLGGFPLTGLLGATSGEVMTDIDVRPGTGGLYGRSNFGRLYLINPLSGFSQAIGIPVTNNAFFSGFDIDPTTDRVRVVGDNTTNILISPVFGTGLAIQAALRYRAGDVAQGQVPRVTGLAYTNSFPFATRTGLFGIDHARNTLVVIGNAAGNAGLTRTIGSLGFDVTPRVGFDVNPLTGQAFAVLQRPGQPSGFYVVSFATGRAGLVGAIAGGRVLSDIAFDLRNPGGTFFVAPTAPTFSASFPGGTLPLGPGIVRPLGPGLTAPLFSTTSTGFNF